MRLDGQEGPRDAARSMPPASDETTGAGNDGWLTDPAWGSRHPRQLHLEALHE